MNPKKTSAVRETFQEEYNPLHADYERDTTILAMRVVLAPEKPYTNRLLNPTFALLGRPQVVKVDRFEYVMNALVEVVKPYGAPRRGMHFWNSRRETLVDFLSVDREGKPLLLKAFYISWAWRIPPIVALVADHLLLERAISQYSIGRLYKDGRFVPDLHPSANSSDEDEKNEG